MVKMEKFSISYSINVKDTPVIQTSKHGLKSGIFLRMWLNELFCFFARTFYNPRLKNSLVSFFEIVLFKSTFWAFKETVSRKGHFRMDAKIISYINLHQYVASGPTGKLTGFFFLKLYFLIVLFEHLKKQFYVWDIFECTPKSYLLLICINM